MKESVYKAKLIRRLEAEFVGCLVFDNNPNKLQGVPDILVLFKTAWAGLEIKRSEKESRQPNQEYYVGLMNQMSYASFIYPENEERVFNDLHTAFSALR